MINVTAENFETEVMLASQETFVLIDFWAPWCGPCKVIGPLLEKLETDYAGRFTLAKVDSDQEQELSQAFGIRSIPTCVLMKDGKPVDGFMGALPEGKLREFLDKHIPPADDADQADDLAKLEDALPQDLPAVAQRMADALAAKPDNDDLRFDYVKLLISTGDLDAAAQVLGPGLAQIPVPLRFEALKQWMSALKFAATDPRGTWEIAQFDALIETNKRDFEARFAKSQLLVALDEWTLALDELLEIIMRDKKWHDEAPRKLFVAILELLTPPKPKAGSDNPGKTAGGIELAGKAVVQEDGQAALVSGYRRRLSMMLN
jgi:putative thioredoxin